MKKKRNFPPQIFEQKIKLQKSKDSLLYSQDIILRQGSIYMQDDVINGI